MKEKNLIPHFKSQQQEARFWDTHSPLDYDFRPAKVRASAHLKKRLISIRIQESLLKSLKQIALKKHIPYQTLVHILLEKTVREELHKAA